jgi:peroxiredoxin
MTLRDELQAVYDEGQRVWPAPAREIIARTSADLAATGMERDALGAGDRAPAFELPSASGGRVALEALLTQGPVVLTFYRGAWCPYCNVALRGLQQSHDAIRARGARLVAVSPQVPDESLSLAEKHGLAFDVLSDVGSGTAKQYGIAFELAEEMAGLSDQLGFDLARVNGGYGRTLPLPATFVIDAGGIIRWAFVDTDYVKRAEPADILAALDAL